MSRPARPARTPRPNARPESRPNGLSIVPTHALRALGSNQEISAPPSSLGRWLQHARDALRPLTTKAAGKCGFMVREPARPRGRGTSRDEVSIVLEAEQGGTSGRRVARVRGVATCKSSWGCPVCGQAKRLDIARRLASAYARWCSRGGGCLILTLTIRHGARDDLALLNGILNAAWAGFTASAPWQRIRARAGIDGVVRLVDVTHGHRAGWHPHVHALLWIGRDRVDIAGERERRALRRKLLKRWQLCVARAALEQNVPADRASAYVPGARGVSLEVAQSGSYGVKLALRATMLARDPREQPSGRTMWDIIAGAVAGVARDEALWSEYTQAMTRTHVAPGLAHLEQRIGQLELEDKRRRRGRTPRGAGSASRNTSVGSSAGAAVMRDARITVAVIPRAIFIELQITRGAVPRLLTAAEDGGLRALAASAAQDLWHRHPGDPSPPTFTEVEILMRLFDPAARDRRRKVHCVLESPDGPHGRRTLIEIHRCGHRKTGNLSIRCAGCDAWFLSTAARWRAGQRYHSRRCFQAARRRAARADARPTISRSRAA